MTYEPPGKLYIIILTRGMDDKNYFARSSLKSFLRGLQATEIDSGCCGMAGSFGYEQEHYQLSMKIGEFKLFPAIRAAEEESVILANGFSCRNQITHGTNKPAYHIAQILEN